MTELKTLKDLTRDIPEEYGNGWPGEVNANELRQEAIKWIKAGQHEIKQKRGTVIDIFTPNTRRLFKHFFNITEEELK